MEEKLEINPPTQVSYQGKFAEVVCVCFDTQTERYRYNIVVAPGSEIIQDLRREDLVVLEDIEGVSI